MPLRIRKGAPAETVSDVPRYLHQLKVWVHIATFLEVLMRKPFMTVMMIMILLFAVGTTHPQQQPSPGYDSSTGKGGDWFCPWCGRGEGFGPGMSAMPYQHGMGIGHVLMRYGPLEGPAFGTAQSWQDGELAKDDAKNLVQNYLRQQKNQNLKMGQISDKGALYEVDIVAKEGSLAERLQVDKKNGWFRSVSSS